MAPKLTIKIFATHFDHPPNPSVYSWVLYKGKKRIARSDGCRTSAATAKADAANFCKATGIAATILPEVQDE